MVDPIAKKLDEEWTEPVVREANLDKVRAWLGQRRTEDIQLYLKTFEKVLGEKHPARARLLIEELERRKKPRPDRVKELWAWLYERWMFAFVVVFTMSVVGAASARNTICEGFPTLRVLCVQSAPSPASWGEEPFSFGG